MSSMTTVHITTDTHNGFEPLFALLDESNIFFDSSMISSDEMKFVISNDDLRQMMDLIRSADKYRISLIKTDYKPKQHLAINVTDKSIPRRKFHG